MRKKAVIAIDGACHGNGKPDCVSAGGIFVKPTTYVANFSAHVVHELNSTSQRGELRALIEGLKVGLTFHEVHLITDSEYVANALNKNWLGNWQMKGWVTATGSPVKNRDLWEQVIPLFQRQNEIVVYHIKGHVIPFGKVAARKLLATDPTGEQLYDEVGHKFELEKTLRVDSLNHAMDVFEKNHGFRPPWYVLRQMIQCNITADLVASNYLDRVVSIIK